MTRTQRSRPFRIVTIILVTMLWLAMPMSGRADDQPAPGEPAPGGVTDRNSETLTLMAEAEARLTNGQLDDETAALQGRIVENLDAILRDLRERAQSAPIPSDSPPSAGGGESARDPSGDGGGADGSADSEAQPRTADDADVGALEQRKNLASAVWGHLPPRVRERMYNSFSESFLPAYDDLVRDYYKALADESSRESP